MYERAGCHLCEDLVTALAELVDPTGYQLERVDIDQQDELRGRFNELVPVLMHEEQEICHHFLDLCAVRAVLASYNRDCRNP